MTFEQLVIFVAVAEREHLTRAAAALRLTPSAVSASIKALEAFYNVHLFERVGRGIELTTEGRVFLKEARETLARVRAAEMVLNDLGDLKRGSVAVYSSQTIANYWLPPRLVRFHAAFPEIDVQLTVGNTRTVTAAVIEGSAELGFIEGTIDEPLVSLSKVAEDTMVVVVPADHDRALEPCKDIAALVAGLVWIMREPGSGTRSEFEAALHALDLDPSNLRIGLTLPSNEAILHALLASRHAAALSRTVVAPFLENGRLMALDLPLPPRNFTSLRHKERHLSSAARKLSEFLRDDLPRKTQRDHAAGRTK